MCYRTRPRGSVFLFLKLFIDIMKKAPMVLDVALKCIINKIK